MQIFLTGASIFNEPQLDGFKSLGGFISSSPVPNDLINSIFDQISQNLLFSKSKPEYRFLAIYNDGAVKLTGLQCWLDLIDMGESDVLDNPFCSFQIGFKAPTTDSCGDIILEKLPTPNSKPYNTTLVNANGEVNAISLPDLDVGMYLGICISRTILPYIEPTDQQYQDILAQTLSLSQTEQVNLVFQSPDLP